jgi:hypothetical protein
MAHIFISYAREDQSRVAPLAKALEELNWTVFWDRTIPTGKTWRQVIDEALGEASSVIVAWSKSSVKSTWVLEEADRGREGKKLIPILIDNVKPPLGFGEIQTADLVNWEPGQSSAEFEKFIDDISAMVGPSIKGVGKGEPKKVRNDEPETEMPSRKAAFFSNKYMAAAYKQLAIVIAILVGIGLAIIAIWQSVDWNPVTLVLVGVCGWAAIGAISGKDRRIALFLVVGYFLVAIIWKSLDDGLNANARAIFYGGGSGALMGAVLGRFFTRFKEKT